MTNLLWLGTLCQQNQIKECEETINEILTSTTARIHQSYVVNNLSIVRFSIGDIDIPKVSLTRLKTSDIKWESDFPQYQIGRDLNVNILKQFKAISQENNWDSELIEQYNGLILTEYQKYFLKTSIPNLTDEEVICSLLASCEEWEGDAESWKEILDNNLVEKKYEIKIIQKVYNKYAALKKVDEGEADNMFLKYFTSSNPGWEWDIANNIKNTEDKIRFISEDECLWVSLEM